MAFSVLFVCTGNICRSPAAEFLFRARIGTAPIVASSAGTSGLSGWDMDAPSARALRAFGVDPSGHVARRMTREIVAAADLVLTADTDHRSIVVRAEPLAFRRAFTMREFARLGAALPLPPEALPLWPPTPNQPLPPKDKAPTPAALRARVQEIAEQRGRAEAAEPGADNIADPFGAGFEVARASMQTVSTAVDGVIKALGVTPVPEPFNVGNLPNESPRP